MSVACLEVFGVEEATGIAGVTWWVLDEYFWVALLTSIRVYTTVAVLPVLEKNCENFWSFLVDHRKTRRKNNRKKFRFPFYINFPFYNNMLPYMVKSNMAAE